MGNKTKMKKILIALLLITCWVNPSVAQSEQQFEIQILTKVADNDLDLLRYEIQGKGLFPNQYKTELNFVTKVYDDTIEEAGIMEYAEDYKMPVTIIKLTPEMKKAVQQDSQALFEILGTFGASGVAAKAVSDSQGNNTISN